MYIMYLLLPCQKNKFYNAFADKQAISLFDKRHKIKEFLQKYLLLNF